MEFAIIAGLLLMILFGIIQLGIAFNRTQGLNSAAREGARAASIGVPISGVVTRVREAQSLFRPEDVTVDIEYSNDDGSTWTLVCGTSGTACTTQTTAPCPPPCGVDSLIQVTAKVSSAGAIGTRYAIAIPLWASVKVGWSGAGTFRVDKSD